MTRRRLSLAAAAATLAAAAVFVPPAGSAEGLALVTLSNRADLVSGGDVLVEVVLPPGATADGLAVDVGGRDLSTAFATRAGGRVLGLVTGLAVGDNVVTARLPDGQAARLTVTNHPIGGPVFSGPQLQPWRCAAGATDDQCNRPPSYAFLYKSTNPLLTGLRAYDPDNPPSDVATTTTDQGRTVPFVVRVETGAIDRDEYRIAVLYDPSQPWDPTAPQPGYNGKLVITHGASCDTDYEQADAPDVLNDAVLGKGFAVMSHALDNAGHNCNIVTEAEALVMTKEYLADHYGEIRYTIGSGCSGGSLVQNQVANAYPGVYQGITPQCSFPDAWSQTQYEDYHLLRDYFEHPEKWAPGVAWPQQPHQAAVNGHPNATNPLSFTTVIPDKGYPNRACNGVEDEELYDPDTNPDGVRCTFQDYMVNVFGRRPGDGFARRPWDNVGVQYGLQALLDQTISPDQFVDLNEKIGGRTIDHEWQQAREEADPFALAALYRSGAINDANNLDQVAIVDLRGPDPGAFHDVYRTYALKARLEREHGHSDNLLLWRGPVALFGDHTFENASIFAVDRWLAEVEKDDRDVPLAQKIVEDKPDDLTHRCTDGSGHDVQAQACDAVVESYSTPRMVAGGPLTDDVMKCALKPLDPDDYPGVSFTAAHLDRLAAVFPTGVCDFARPGVAQQDTVPWMTYTGGPGGRPLGDPPASVPLAVAGRGGGGGGDLPATGSWGLAAGGGAALVAFVTVVARRRVR